MTKAEQQQQRQEWEERIAEYRSSKQSVREWCAADGVRPHIAPRFWEKVEKMIQDLSVFDEHRIAKCEVYPLDARSLNHLKPLCFDALITSAAYANRHDYSRIFQIELLFMGLQEGDIFTLR